MPKKQLLQDRGLVRVTFDLPADVNGKTVHLVGDFTSWKGIPMERRKEGGWRATVDLEPGRSYEFRYLVDGARWENDWAADRYVRNPYGNENSVVETPVLRGETATATATARGTEMAGGGTATAKKRVTKKATAKKATKKATKKAAAKKSTAKKATRKKSAAKKATRKTTAKKTSAKRAVPEKKQDTTAPKPAADAKEKPKA